MAPEHLRFGGGAADTLLHPLVAVWMLIAIAFILTLPRQKALAPFLIACFTIPVGQVVVLGGLHFTVLRILILAGLARRAMTRRETSAGSVVGSVKSIDALVWLWCGLILIATFFEFKETQAFIKGLGDFLDAVGGYLVIRFLIQDVEDVRRSLKVFAVLTVILGCCMINEQVTHRNVFGLLGGAPLFPQVRDGKLRSQAAFAVYIDAGVFGATLIPLFIWLWSDAKSRIAAALGMAGAITMMLTSNSSTPILGFMGAIIGLLFWPLREGMRFVRWALSLILIGLHLVMKGPVWSLIARVDLTGSSSGYHRYYLVDNCIRHFSDWWLIGYKDYPNWGWDMWDLSNQYVAVALTGGLAALVVFIGILSRCFAAIGTARKHASVDRKQQWFLWCLGAALLAHVVGWFGCSYMAQMNILLFVFWTMISVATFEAMLPTVAEPSPIKDSSEDVSEWQSAWAQASASTLLEP